MARYDNILDTIGNTPLVKLNNVAPDGVNIYVKVESFNPMGSVKDRVAKAIIEQAEATGELNPGQTVIEATNPPARNDANPSPTNRKTNSSSRRDNWEWDFIRMSISPAARPRMTGVTNINAQSFIHRALDRIPSITQALELKRQ